jgi:hypothetical protein
MALPPTLQQEKNNPFPIDAARCEDYPQDPTSPHDNISPGDSPPPLGARGIADMLALPLPPNNKKKPFPIDAACCDGKEECPEDATIPRDNGSPGDTPPRPSRAPTVSARDVEMQGIANMALPPTPNNQQQKPFPIDAARFPIDPNDALTDKASDKARQMKGLKRKRKFTRTLEAPSSTNQKTTNFDYAAFPALNVQQICAATAPAKARSPLFKVKRDRRAFKASLEASITKRRRLQWTAERQQKKIADLKGRNNQLMQDILRERCASNKIIDKAMSDARKISTEALEMMREANLQVIKDDEHIISKRSRASANIQEERLFQARESDRLRRKCGDTIDKLHREQEASIKLSTAKSNKKYQDVRIKMSDISTKLKDQRMIWQTSLKKQISNERERRRCSIQQQLDKSSAVEDQFMEIINGLEEMNDELAEEVKSTKNKKDRRVALKLYDKSKDATKKRLNKLQLEKEEKNVLKDELTQALKMHESQQNEIARLLNMQQAQQQVIEEYKSMIDGFKSSRLNLKREVKLGRRGGARWPLWVTKVMSGSCTDNR